MKLLPTLLTSSALAIASPQLSAGCFSQCCNTHRVAAADALVEARVLSLSPYLCEQSNIIHTSAELQIVTKFNEQTPVPQTLTLTYPGGSLDGRSSFDSRSLDLEQDAQYFIYLAKGEDGKWTAYQASAEKCHPDTAQTQRSFYSAVAAGETVAPPQTTNEVSEAITEGVSKSMIGIQGFTSFQGKPVRLTLGDANQIFQVEVDTEFLPAGISQSQAMTAVQNALDAWADVSSLEFEITRNYNFDAPASTLDGGDQVIHIQLHDTGTNIASDFTLGVGGGGVSNAGGGTVKMLDFHKAQHRYVIINHSSSTNQNATALEEVLTHEVGHALGLAHSSENSTESDPDLNTATMFFQLHNDGRGATLQPYDTNQMVIGYPTNTPPVSSDTLLRAVGRSAASAIPLANQLNLTGFDANGDPLTYELVSSTSNNGVFTFTPATGAVTYKSNGAFNAANIAPNYPTSFSTYDSLTFRVSDGVNKSAEQSVYVTEFIRDDTPSSELPSTWVTANFGGGSPLHTDDPDGDKVDNLTEFLRDTDPNDASDGGVSNDFNVSANAITVNDLLRGDRVVIEKSSNLSSWTPISSYFQQTTPTSTTQTFQLPSTASDSELFYRATINR